MAKTSKEQKTYIIEVIRFRMVGECTSRKETGTLEELKKHFAYTLEAGASWSGYPGCKKVNRDPKNIRSLVLNLNKAEENLGRHYPGKLYSLVPEESIK